MLALPSAGMSTMPSGSPTDDITISNLATLSIILANIHRCIVKREFFLAISPMTSTLVEKATLTR